MAEDLIWSQVTLLHSLMPCFNSAVAGQETEGTSSSKLVLNPSDVWSCPQMYLVPTGKQRNLTPVLAVAVNGVHVLCVELSTNDLELPLLLL